MSNENEVRQERGLTLATTRGAVERVNADLFAVRSATGVGQYRVERAGESWKCNCPDSIKREGAACKHVHATRYYLQAEHDTEHGTVTERVSLTRGQAWAAYDAAQTGEIQFFDDLLRDLVESVHEPEQVIGRPRIPLRESIFCAVQKVYSQLSCRRAKGLFQNAVEHGQLKHAPSFVTTSRALNDKTLTPILHDLITRTALPLAGLENVFAVDSTGFRTTSFNAYCVEKHGTRRTHSWLKAHLMVGTRTHVVSRVIITDANGADAPQFTPLVTATSEAGFQIEELAADKAYSSRANVATAASVGAEAFIPFKSNATGKAHGTSFLWKKAFHYFQLHREEFDQHYHKRSNVESVNSAIKRKFGETLKSKNRVAQENELLCKILAYNITVLIHEMHENGIDPRMFQKPAACVQSRAQGGL